MINKTTVRSCPVGNYDCMKRVDASLDAGSIPAISTNQWGCTGFDNVEKASGQSGVVLRKKPKPITANDDVYGAVAQAA